MKSVIHDVGKETKHNTKSPSDMQSKVNVDHDSEFHLYFAHKEVSLLVERQESHPFRGMYLAIGFRCCVQQKH